MDPVLHELGLFGRAVWDQFVAMAAPMVSGLLMTLLTAGVAALKRKLDTAVIPAATAVETEARINQARGNVKTPGSIKLESVRQSVTSELGKTWLGKAALATGDVAKTVEAYKPLVDAMAEAAKSASIRPPRGSGEYPVVLPKDQATVNFEEP